MDDAAVVPYLGQIAGFQAACRCIVGMDPHALGIGLFHPRVVVVDRMAATLGMPADQLKGIFLAQRIVGAFGAGEIAGQGRDICLAEVGQPLGIDLDLARGGLEGVTHGIADLIGIGDIGAAVFIGIAAIRLKVGIGRQLGLLRTQAVVDVFQPAFAGLVAGRPRFPQAEALGHIGQPVVFVAATEDGLDDAVVVQQVVALAPGAGHVVFLEEGGAGQQNIGKLGTGGHKDIGAEDKLALAFVLQYLDGVVDVGMLVDQRVAGQIEEHPDVGIQFFHALDMVVLTGHLRAALDGLQPQKDRDGALIGAVADGEAGLGLFLRHTHAGCAAAGDADIAGEGGQGRDGADGLFAVADALGAEAGQDAGRLGAGIFTGEGADGFGRNTGDRFGPLGCLGGAVEAAKEIVFKVLGFICAFGHMRFIKAEAETIHKGLILQVFL